MLKYFDYAVVTAEVPDEISLAINITGCPNRCWGCHSPHLREDIGDPLDIDTLKKIISIYEKDLTCVAFMGGDANPSAVACLAYWVKNTYPSLKTCWYTGRTAAELLAEDILSADTAYQYFDYVKVGPFKPEFGPLDKETTNQRMYSITDCEWRDVTSKFWRGKV